MQVNQHKGFVDKPARGTQVNRNTLRSRLPVETGFIGDFVPALNKNATNAVRIAVARDKIEQHQAGHDDQRRVSGKIETERILLQRIALPARHQPADPAFAEIM